MRRPHAVRSAFVSVRQGSEDDSFESHCEAERQRAMTLDESEGLAGGGDDGGGSGGGGRGDIDDGLLSRWTGHAWPPVVEGYGSLRITDTPSPSRLPW